MNKQEFLSRLSRALSGLPQDDVEEQLAFYREMIDDRVEDGLSEEAAVAEIGPVDEVVSQIVADTPLPPACQGADEAKAAFSGMGDRTEGERTMKHATAVWLITAAALVMIGALVFVGVMAKNHWDFAALGNTKYETRTFDISEGFENISIHSDTADIVFAPSDDGKCRAVFYDHPKVSHSASVRDGTLSVETVDTRKWYEQISILYGIPKITVYLPRGGYASVLIDESTGDIVIPEDFAFDDVTVSASTGDVSCHASSSGLTRIGTSTGDIHIENISAGALELSVSTGKVEVSSVVCAGDVDVTVSTGKTILTDVSCGSVHSGGSTGDITMEDVIAAGLISVERSTGDVRLDRCDAAELLVTTDTGDVSGTLLSEKVFIAQSDTGRVKVPATATGGTCKITTDTGDITIAVP